VSRRAIRYGLRQFLLLGCFFSLLGPLAAQSGEFGFGGQATSDRLTPLWLILPGNAPGDSVEIVSTDLRNGLTAACQMPAMPGLSLPFYVAAGDALQVRLLSGITVVAEFPFQPADNRQDSHLILAVGQDAASLVGLNRALDPVEPVRVAGLRPEQLPPSALGLDGVSAIVIKDGPLSAATVRALRAWLAAGGCLAISQARPDGLATRLRLGQESLATGAAADPRSVAFGLGHLVVAVGPLVPAALASQAGRWGQLLGLRSFERPQRLNPWIEAQPRLGWGWSAGDELALSGRTALVVLLWGLGLVLIALWRRRRWLWPSLAYSLAWLAIMFFGASLVGPRDIGHALRARFVLLPESAGAFASLLLAPPDPLAQRGLQELRPELTYELTMPAGGVNRLTFYPDSGTAPRLIRSGLASAAALRRVFPGGVELAAWLEVWPAPVERAVSRWQAGRLPWGTRLARYAPDASTPSSAGGRWQEWDRVRGDWRDLASFPPWLEADAVWAVGLVDALPDQAFLFGRQTATLGDIRLNGLPLRALVWALPLADLAGGQP